MRVSANAAQDVVANPAYQRRYSRVEGTVYGTAISLFSLKFFCICTCPPNLSSHIVYPVNPITPPNQPPSKTAPDPESPISPVLHRCCRSVLAQQALNPLHFFASSRKRESERGSGVPRLLLCERKSKSRTVQTKKIMRLDAGTRDNLTTRLVVAPSG